MPHILAVQSAVSTPAASSPGSLLEVHILRPYHRPTESGHVGRGPEICVIASPSGDFVIH